jgi:hypothetical protein
VILTRWSNPDIQELNVVKSVLEQRGGFCDILRSLPPQNQAAGQRALDNIATILNRADNLAFFEFNAENMKGDFTNFFLNGARPPKPGKVPTKMIDGAPNPPFVFLVMTNYLVTTRQQSLRIAAEVDAQILPLIHPCQGPSVEQMDQVNQHSPTVRRTP